MGFSFKSQNALKMCGLRRGGVEDKRNARASWMVRQEGVNLWVFEKLSNVNSF